MGAAAVPFMLVGQGALAKLESVLERALSAWAADWGVALSEVALAVVRAADRAASDQAGHPGAVQWRHQARASGRTVWLACDPGTIALQKAIFGAPCASPSSAAPAGLAAAGAHEALDALIDALAHAALGTPQEAAHSVDCRADGVLSHVWRRGAGAALATVTIGRWNCSVLLDGAALAALLPRPAALPGLNSVDYRACLAQVPVALKLVAGGARVSLGSLLALSEGDVISLGNRSDAPLTLRSQAGRSVLKGYLGRCGEAVAIELTADASHLSGD